MQFDVVVVVVKTVFFEAIEEWTKHSSILTYADDTSTSCHGKSQEEVMVKLEEDSKKHFTIHGIKWISSK